MEYITSKQGKSHVTAGQFSDIIQGIVGTGSYVLNLMEQLKQELVSNNELQIHSGMLVHHGQAALIDRGGYESAKLTNGTQGMKRIDLVVVKFTHDQDTDLGSCELAVIQGTPTAGTPTAPQIKEGNIQEGDAEDNCPLVQLTLDGIQVVDVKQLVPVMEKNLDEINATLAQQPRIISGSVGKVSKDSSVLLFTLDQLQQMFGVQDGNIKHYYAFLNNGDAAVGTHIEGATWSGTNLDAVFDTKRDGNIRINYTIIYNPNPYQEN